MNTQRASDQRGVLTVNIARLTRVVKLWYCPDWDGKEADVEKNSRDASSVLELRMDEWPSTTRPYLQPQGCQLESALQRCRGSPASLSVGRRFMVHGCSLLWLELGEQHKAPPLLRSVAQLGGRLHRGESLTRLQRRRVLLRQRPARIPKPRRSSAPNAPS